MRSRAALLAGAVALAAAGPAAAAPSVTEFPIPTAGSVPQEIVQAPDGSLWFTELGADQIGKVTPSEPPVIEEFAALGGLTNPLSITVGPDGNVWYTGAVMGAQGVGRINPANPADVQAYVVPGTSGVIRGIAAGPDGNLWTTDTGDDVAIRISTAGAKLNPEIDLDPANPVNPRAITRGPGGTMWVAGFGGYIVRISGDGATATSFDTPGSSAWDIAAGLDGNLWYTAPNAAVGRITPAGAATEYPLPGGATDPFGLAVGPDAGIWFAQAVGNTIGRITTAGPPSITALGGLTAASRPEYITQGAQNTLWFTERDGNRIGRISGIDAGIDIPEPPAGDTTRPVVERLRLAPRRFRLGRALPSATAVRRGPTIRYNLSEPSTVTLSFARRRAGRRDRKRWRPVRPKVSFPGGVAGAERIRFAGRLTRRKSLLPGVYRLALRAKDAAGNTSEPARTTFRVLAPTKRR